jgi:uncharacterized protein
MGIATPQLLTGTVMHKRLHPKVHAFHYGIYYLALPLSKLGNLPLAYNRFSALSFYDKDHGPCDGSSLEAWVRGLLNQYKVHADGEITLVCMPRILGYVFNPVSFWFCQDKQGQIRAVLCEVHNTFGERHTYLCKHENQQAITGSTMLCAEKLFHVSPFLKREGHYQFRFDMDDSQSEQAQFKVQIDFYQESGQKQLITALVGCLQPLTKQSLRFVFWRYPLVTIKAVLMIHWHALKLVLKGIQYIAKPKQKQPNVSITD